MEAGFDYDLPRLLQRQAPLAFNGAPARLEAVEEYDVETTKSVGEHPVLISTQATHTASP